MYVGRTGGELYPVAAMTAHLAIRGRAPGPFFLMPGNVPISRDTLVKKVRGHWGHQVLRWIIILSTASRLGQQQQQQRREWRTV